MNPLINRIFRSKEHGPPRLSNSRRNASSDRPLSREKDQLVPRIVARQGVDLMRTTEGFNEQLMKQRIILPTLKPPDLSMTELPPKTPMDGRRSRQVSTLRKKLPSVAPLSSEELPAFDAGFFPTQSPAKLQETPPAEESKLAPSASYNVIEASGLTQKLFGGEQNLQIFEYMKAISLNPDLSEEFCYMNRGQLPYDYQIVEYEQRNRLEYLTVSIRGITFYSYGETDFYTREQLLREIKLYNRVRLIGFFDNYLLVKTIKIWKNAMLKFRFDRASAVLEKEHYGLGEPTNKFMERVGNRLYELSYINFLELRISKTKELTDFERDLKDNQLRVQEEFNFYDSELYKELLQAADESTRRFRRAHRISIGESGSEKMGFLLMDSKKSEMKYTQLATLKGQETRMVKLAKLVDMLRQSAKLKSIENGLRTVSQHLYQAYTKFYHENSGTHISWIFVRVRIDARPRAKPRFQCTPDFSAILASFEHFAGSILRHVCKNHREFVKEPEFARYERELPDPEQERTLKAYVDMTAAIEIAKNSISEELDRAFLKVEEFLGDNEQLLAIYEGTLLTEPLDYYLQNVHLKQYLESYEEQRVVLRDIKNEHECGIFFVDFSEAHEQLNAKFNEKYTTVTTSVPAEVIRRSDTLATTIRSLYDEFKANPSSIEGYIAFAGGFKDKKIVIDDVSNHIDELKELEEMLYRNRIKIGEKAKLEINQAIGFYIALRKRIEQIERDEEKLRTHFEKQLELMAPTIETRAEGLLERLYAGDMVISPSSEAKKVVAFLRDIEVDFLQLEEQKNNFYTYQKKLATGYTELEKFCKLEREFRCLLRLWEFKERYDVIEGEMLRTSYRRIDYQMAQSILSQFHKEINRGFKDLETVEILQNFKAIAENQINLLFACRLLTDEDLLDRHFEELRKLLHNDRHPGKLLFSTEGLLLSPVELQEKYGVREHRDKIEAVSIKASNEALIIRSMNTVEAFWKTAKLHFEQNDHLVKNETIYYLAANEEVSEKVDENIIQLTSLAGSKYVEYVRESVVRQKQIYQYFRELLDLWLETQREWFRLHPILMSASSIKYYSGAYTQFASLDSTMRKFNKQMSDMLNVKKIAEDYQLQSYFNTVRSCHAELERLRKTLEEYMAQKRNNYNRFYFLTDGELITLLQEIRDFQSMEPYLRLCFDLDGFIVEKEMVVGVRSSYESFKVRSLFFKGEADEWFRAVEENTRVAVRSLIKANLPKYRLDTQKNLWKELPFQVLLVLELLIWTEVAQSSLETNNVATFAAFCKDEVELCTNKLLSNTTTVPRLTLSGLLMQAIHLSECATYLANNETTIKDFRWAQQLRMYIQEEEVQVQQICYTVPYGYEYYRPYTQPAHTAVTDCMLLSTFRAFSSKQGLIVDGASFTGKTETIRQVSLLTGNYFKNYTCSADVEPTYLMRFLTGVCLTGVWGCMDSFLRLTFEMMSLVFQKCLEVKTQRLLEQPIAIEKTALNIHRSAMFFIARDIDCSDETMEKARMSFNQVFLLRPDYRKICQWTLLADGFRQWKSLAAKICGVLDFSRELFAHKSYNFELSAVGRVLRKALQFHSQANYPTEEAVVYEAFRLEVMSNLIQEDRTLFKSILKKYFNYEEEIIMSVLASLILRHPKLEQQGLRQRYQQLEDGIVSTGCVIITGQRTSKSTLIEVFQQRTGFEMLRLFPRAQMNIWSDGMATLSKKLDPGSNVILVFDGELGRWVELVSAARAASNSVVIVNGEKLSFPYKLIFETRSLKDSPPSFISVSKVVHIENKADGQLQMTEFLKKSHLSPEAQRQALEFAAPYLKELSTEEVDTLLNTLVCLYPTHVALREKVLQKLVIWILAYLFRSDPTFWNKHYLGKFQELYFSKSAEDFAPIASLTQDLIIQEEQLFHDIIVCTKQVAYAKLLVGSFVQAGKHILLAGTRLSFKTSTLRYCCRGYLNVIVSAALTNQRSLEAQLDDKLENVRKGSSLYWTTNAPFIVQVDDLHLASDHISEAVRKIATTGELRLRSTLQQKTLQKGAVVATTGDITVYPRTLGPLTMLPLEQPTAEVVAAISHELLTSFLKYHNFRREVVEIAGGSCVTCISILFNDMQKVHGMQLNIVRIFSEIMKHMLSIRRNVYIETDDYVNLFVAQLVRITMSRATASKELENEIRSEMENALKVAFRGIPTTSEWMSSDDKMHKVTVEEVIFKLPSDLLAERILFEEAIKLALALNNQHHVEHGHTILAGLAGSGKKFLCWLSSRLSERDFIDIKSEMLNQSMQFRPCLFQYIRKVMFEEARIIIYQSSLQVFLENKSFYEQLIVYTGEEYDFWNAEEKLEIEKERKLREEDVGDLRQVITQRLIKNLAVVFAFEINKDLKGVLADSNIFSCYYCELAEWPQQALAAVAQKITSNNVAIMSMLHYQLSPLIEKHTKHSPSLKNFERFLRLADKLNLELSGRVAQQQELFRQVHYKLAESCQKIREWTSKAEMLRTEVKVQLIRLEKNIERMEEESRQLQEIKLQEQASEEKLKEQKAQLDLKKAALDKEVKRLNRVMERLEKSLSHLNRKEFGEIKTLSTTHNILKFSLECLTILMGFETTTAGIHSMLADANLLMNVKTLNLKITDNATKEKLRTRIHNNKQFTPEQIEKINVAGKALCEWIYGVVDFWSIFEDSEHKHSELKQAEDDLAKTQIKMKETHAEIESLSKKLAQLDEENKLARQKKHEAEIELSLFEKRLANAAAITPYLMNEESACLDQMVRLKDTAGKVTGNCILTSLLMYYLCPMDYKLRMEVLARARTIIQYENVLSEEDPYQQFQKPSHVNLQDRVVQNLLCIDFCEGVPLIIDPERKALQTLSEHYPGMIVSSSKHQNFLGELLEAIATPGVLLLNDIESIDYSGLLRMLTGDKRHSQFKLLLYTDLSYEKVKEEILSKTIPINWRSSVFESKSRLLTRLIQVNRPDLVVRRKENERLVMQNETRVEQIRIELFERLKERALMILEDEDFIHSINESTMIQENIRHELEELRRQKEDIEALEAKYREQVVNIDLVVATLQEASPTSLDIITELMVRDQDNLIRIMKWALKVLPSEQRHSYLFMACLRVKHEHNIQNYYVRYLFEEIPSLHQPKVRKPVLCASLSEAAWKDLHALLQFGPKFEHLIDNIVRQPKEWEVWFYSHKLELPACMNVDFNMVETLLIVRTLKPYKLFQFMQKYIEETFGFDFTNPQNQLSDEEFLSQTDNRYPVMLPGGLDAFKLLTVRMNRREPVILSLARDKEQLTADIEKLVDRGEWVALVDCEVINQSSNRVLEDLVKRLMEVQRLPSNFRLFILGLSRMQSDYLNNLSVSMYLEEPTIKHLMKELVTPERFRQDTSKELNKLSWLLCLAHSTVVGKNKYPLAYDKEVMVGRSELDSCFQVIQFMRDHHLQVNYDNIAQLFSEFYAARADTLNDKMIVAGVFSSFLDDAVANSFNISAYPIPEANFVQTVDELPATDEHEIFGFHFNIMIAMDSIHVENIEQGARAYRIHEISSDQHSTEADLLRINDFARKVPTLIDIEPPEKWIHYSRNLESQKINTLLRKVHQRFEECRETAHKDIFEVSRPVRIFYSCIQINILPQELHQLYPIKSTNRSFTRWVDDLANKASFFKAWQSAPIRVFRPCCFFNFALLIQSFKMGEIQRKNQPGDFIKLLYKFAKGYDSKDVLITEGILLSDLMLDMCRYNTDRRCLDEPIQGNRLAKAPIMHISATSTISSPVRANQEAPSCSLPVYAQASRDRLITWIDVETDRSVNWLAKGAAIISL